MSYYDFPITNLSYDELVSVVEKIRAHVDITPRAMDCDDVAEFLIDISMIIAGDA